MLKLVKYEITQFYQRYLLIYGIFLMICLCSNYFPELFVNDDILYVRIAMFSMLAVFLVNTVINFNRSMYKSSGYLTLTLPLSTKKIVGAKLLGSLCWFLISMIVLWSGSYFIINQAISTSSFSQVQTIKNLLLTMPLVRLINNGEFNLVVLKQLAMIIQVGTFILSFYAIITFTKTKYVPRFKMLAGFVIYVIVFIFGVNMFNWVSIKGNLGAVSLLIVVIIFCLILSLGFYFFTVYLIDNKIEVE